MADGTVLHEIQSLEKQLDRLIPSIEALNTRITTVEADVRNVVGRINSFKCNENLEKLNQLRLRIETAITGLKKDIDAISKDVVELDDTTEGIQTDKKESERIFARRVWSLLERFLSPILAAAAMWLILKLQGQQ